MSKPFTMLALTASVAQAQQYADLVVDQNSAYAAMAFELMGPYCKYKTVQDFLASTGPNPATNAQGGFKLSIHSRTTRDGLRTLNYEFESETKYLNFQKVYGADMVTSQKHEPFCMLRTKGADIPRDPKP